MSENQPVKEEKEKTKKQPDKREVLVVNSEQLSGYNDNLVTDLANYLNEKLKVKAKRDGTDILLNIKDIQLSKTNLRLYIKKFLRKNNIDNIFKITSPTATGNSLLLSKQKEI
ncbi:MAG: 60S ribosomal protein L22 [Candidatus Odinarchaeum yellowstonii]|uniref:60S ribosomal protein L22 n=1 Tax=Odinarchaeota yellowstonii (strain LCB_4) TaxID=1841599 RepID=A0AAF0IBA7_ODILC|nr:MAG: 60S ribosomal protein L22 [Candidatus Odinarchaeum yellowstonii]